MPEGSTKTGTEPDEETIEQAKAWLKPDQVKKLRKTTKRISPSYLSLRNQCVVSLLYDSGLRVNELCSLDVDLLDLEDCTLTLPPWIQKQYPTDRTPDWVTIELNPDPTIDKLEDYLNTRWRDTDALFPSRQSDRMSPDAVRNLITRAAIEANIRPHKLIGRGDPDEIGPHSLRHSVAYRMIVVEDDKDIYDVKKRLRHTSVLTTERIYSHFDRV